MGARDRAAAISAAAAQGKLRAQAAKGVDFPTLGVRVRGGEVRVAKLFSQGKILGPLKGSCAGLTDLVPSHNEYGPQRTALGYGLRNGSCSTFVAFDDGTRHTRQHTLKHPRIYGVAGAVDESVIHAEIARFNQLADLA